mmetsp:Transcript_72515/g.224147  ORF Transcript_72515/g.224147 Transcript_72515/m.224147 type:complete len:300 (+) Transcript_72515:483-1382(+)
MKKHQQAAIHLLLEPGQGQVVVVMAKGVLQLAGDEVHEEKAEDRHEREDAGKDRAPDQHGHHDRNHELHDEQEARNQLSVRERKPGVRDLLGVEDAHEAARERLIHARQDGGRYLQDLVSESVGHERVDDFQHHLYAVEAVLLFAEGEVLPRCLVDADAVEVGYPRVRVGDLLQSTTMAEAHQADNGVPEKPYLLGLRVHREHREGHEAADGVKPLAAHLVQEACALPEAGQGLLRPKVQQGHYGAGQRQPSRGPLHEVVVRDGRQPERVDDVVEVEMAQSEEHGKHRRRDGEHERPQA